MTDLQLTVGVYRYEHTEPLFDGRVMFDGVDVTLDTSPLISDVFDRMAKGELDIAEYGLTYFLRSFDLPDSPFLALPIFPNCNFRTRQRSTIRERSLDSPSPSCAPPQRAGWASCFPRTASESATCGRCCPCCRAPGSRRPGGIKVSHAASAPICSTTICRPMWTDCARQSADASASHGRQSTPVFDHRMPEA